MTPSTSPPDELGHEFREAGQQRRVGEILTPEAFAALKGSDIIAVPLIRRRGHRPQEVLGVIYVKARCAFLDDTGAIQLRHNILRATHRAL